MSEQVTNGVVTENSVVKMRKDGTPRKERRVVSDSQFLNAYKLALANGQPVSKLANILDMAAGSVIQRINSINEYLLSVGRKPLPKLPRASGPRKNRVALADLVESTIGEVESNDA